MTARVPGPFGPFVYDFTSQSWWWSDGLYRIHGFEPGDVVPTTELLVAHKHPDDAAAARAVIEASFSSGEPFALWHRIIDARRRTRHVISVGEGVRDAAGRLVEVRGYMVDVTDSHRAETAQQIDEAVRRSAASRSTIEQAKGLLMTLFDVDEEQAFALLRRRSQNRNVKVRELATELVECLAEKRALGEDPLPLIVQSFREEQPPS